MYACNSDGSVCRPLRTPETVGVWWWWGENYRLLGLISVGERRLLARNLSL